MEDRRLILIFDGGTVDGRQRTLKKTYKYINRNADDSSMASVANIITGLQTKPKIETQVQETRVIG